MQCAFREAFIVYFIQGPIEMSLRKDILMVL